LRKTVELVKIMKKPALPDNESDRLRTLQVLNILDSKPEDRFDTITRLTQHLFNVPIAVISLVDENRQWFKSCMGLDAQETPRDISFCGHAILDPKILIIEDASLDDRFSDNPLVTGAPFIRFYAGKPLEAPNGDRIGTLCIISDKPRVFDEKDQALLTDCAVLVEREIKILYQAAKDEHTDAYNYQGFLTIAQQETNHCAKNNLAATLIFFVVESTQNRTLLEFTVQLKSQLRNIDVFGRMEQNEFILFMRDTDESQAQLVLDNIVSLFNDDPKLPKQGFNIQFAHKIESFRPSVGDKIADIIKEKKPR
jgi:GGDEF domain-containing protein